jgi:hypothetical protein
VSPLVSLQLQGNAFEGEALSSLYWVSSLEILRLDGNPLSGTIDSRLRNLVNLRELWLGETDIGGSLPDELFGLPKLDTLRLGGAKFEGILSDDFRRLKETINVIDLSNNYFSGEIPVSAFGACEDLGRRDLTDDRQQFGSSHSFFFPQRFSYYTVTVSSRVVLSLTVPMRIRFAWPDAWTKAS